MTEAPLRVAVVEPQPGIAERIAVLVERAGAMPVGPDDEHDVALVFADARAEGWAWTVEQWLHRGTPVVLTRLRRAEGSAADLTAMASIPRPFGALELQAAFVDVRERLQAGDDPRDPDPTQPVPTDLRPEIEATHAATDGAASAAVSSEPLAEEVTPDAELLACQRSSALTPVAGVDLVGDVVSSADLRRWAQAASGLVEVWSSLEGDARIDAIERFLGQVLDVASGAERSDSATNAEEPPGVPSGS